MKVQVIEKKKGRINRTTGEVIKGNLRVCAYARVSTEKEEQLNSYNSQLKYYEEKIKSNSEWQYVGIYADEGITGTLDYKSSIKRLEEEKQVLIEKIDKLIDLNLNGTISLETSLDKYNAKNVLKNGSKGKFKHIIRKEVIY